MLGLYRLNFVVVLCFVCRYRACIYSLGPNSRIPDHRDPFPSACSGCERSDGSKTGDRESPMQTTISRGLRRAYCSSTRSACVLKNGCEALRSTAQHPWYSRAYSSVPSPGDRDKTAVGVSPPCHSKGLKVCNLGFRSSPQLPLRFSSPLALDYSTTLTPRRTL